MSEESAKKKPFLVKLFTSRVAPLFFILVAILSAAGFTWSYVQYTQVKKQLNHLSSIEGQREQAQKEIDSLIDKVGKHIVLPEGEEPVIATVSDVDSLVKDQPFYQGAQNGDKVLVYVEAQKAYIYSPERDLLVNVGPAYVDNNQANQAVDDTVGLEEDVVEEEVVEEEQPVEEAEQTEEGSEEAGTEESAQ